MNDERLPGPGDPETWGLVRENTNDPRARDPVERDQRDILLLASTGDAWAMDLVSEAMPRTDAEIIAIAQAILDGDDQLIGDIVRRAIEDDHQARVTP